jgi:MHS family proline/betaine transporter-like MFS transporter
MSTPQSRKAIAVGAIGNILEWYDFAIYGYFATSIGRVFFPKADPVAQVLMAFGIFAIGFLMRPLGGLVIGYIGDRISRQAALTVSIVAMAIPTFLVGIMPGYDTIGIAAPILLTLCRIIQGLSVGGEYPTSLVYMIEQAPANKRGFVGAMGSSSAYIGMLLGSGVGAALGVVLSPEHLDAWGWRIPFLFGLVIGLAGYLLRRGSPEHPAHARAVLTNPVVETFKNHRLLLVKLSGVSAFLAVSFYLIFVYIVSWLELVDKIPASKSLEINTLSMVVLVPLTLLAGALSDRIGRKPVLIIGALAGLIFSVPLMYGMYHQSALVIQLSQIGFALVVGLFNGAMPALIVEAAPAYIRTTVVALGYNLTMGVLGGLTPLVASWLIHRTENEMIPAYMIVAVAAISLVAVMFVSESYKKAI